MNTRTLKDGTIVPELDTPLTLTVYTKCPAKWLLVDRETNEAYVAHEKQGIRQWEKLYNADWSIYA